MIRMEKYLRLSSDINMTPFDGQGLTLIHFSAQPEPYLTLDTSPNASTPPPTPP